MLLVKLPLAERDSNNATVFFFGRSVAKGGGGGVSSQAFLTETMETGHKNCDNFQCMQMTLVMSMWFIFDND